MEFNDCDGFMRPPSFVTVTFGGVDVQNNHFFRVNGNTTTLTNTSETAGEHEFRKFENKPDLDIMDCVHEL